MVTPNSGPNYDRQRELQAFDDTKAGVKGIVDDGITRIPRMFIHQPQNLKNITKIKSNTKLELPVIDLSGVENDPEKHNDIAGKIVDASSSWGFFQVVNHGIPTEILEEMLIGVRGFHEQDTEMKKQYYSRDFTRKMVYNSNFALFSSPTAIWRDTINFFMAPDPPQPQELPSVCREIVMEYSKLVMGLAISLFKLLSEGLGLDPDHLTEIDCAKTLGLFGHYYPPCPEPNLTIGTMRHSDYSFLTILLQDNIGGLQVLHQNQWVAVPPKPGALVVNIGDLLQLISNNKLKSVEHRVLASRLGPRISVASFFGRDNTGINTRAYGPIEELLSEENPPKYRPTTIKGYTSNVRARGVDDTSALLSFEL